MAVSADFMRRNFAGVRGMVWIRLGSRRGGRNDLASFVEGALGTVVEPVVLVTTDGDASVPSDLRAGVADALLGHPSIERWFTQNYDGTVRHPKLFPLPIGLNLHTGDAPARKLAVLEAERRRLPSWEEREEKVLLHLPGKTHPDRLDAERALARCAHVVLVNERLPFARAMELYASHRFALSPRGHGLDCHRTWELLLLETIPILRSGPLDPLFDGLPAALVSDFSEVTDPARLQEWTRRLAPLRDGGRWLARDHWLSVSGTPRWRLSTA